MRIQVQVELTALMELENWGINVQMHDQEGKTILHHAAINGSVSVALLHHLKYCHQLDLDAQDDAGITAMNYADEENQRSHHPLIFRRSRWEETIAAFTELTNIIADTPGSYLL